MKIDHLVWNENVYVKGIYRGICDVEIVYHGGVSKRFISEGVFTLQDHGQEFRNIIGAVSEETMGVSSVILHRVGHIGT